MRAGARACIPMLVGVAPFGLVAGATPAAEGFGVAAALGMSTIIFAGASQLAVVDVLAGGGSAVVAALAAWTINLRLLLYSASMAPHLSHEPLRRRIAASYVLVDQNYAISVAHWANPRTRPSADFTIGGGLLLGTAWVICTLIGAVAGSAVPEGLPLDFAVPLVFLVLLVPVLTTRPSVVAAAVGGTAAVIGAELGAGHLAVMVGAVAGIAAGVVTEIVVGDDAPVDPA